MLRQEADGNTLARAEALIEEEADEVRGPRGSVSQSASQSVIGQLQQAGMRWSQSAAAGRGGVRRLNSCVNCGRANNAQRNLPP